MELKLQLNKIKTALLYIIICMAMLFFYAIVQEVFFLKSISLFPCSKE